MSTLEDSIDEALSPQNLEPASASESLEDSISRVLGQQTGFVNANIDSASRSEEDPSRQKRALEAAKQQKTSRSFALEFLPNLERNMEALRNKELVRDAGSKVLSDFLMEPSQALALRKDIRTYTGFKRALSGRENPGFLEVIKNKFVHGKSMGWEVAGLANPILTEGLQGKIASGREHLDWNEYINRDFGPMNTTGPFDDMIGGSLELLALQSGALPNASVGAVAGAMIAASMAALMSPPATRVVTVPNAARLGFKLGGGGGLALHTFQTEQALALVELWHIKDEHGKPLTLHDKTMGATVVGAMSTPTEYMGRYLQIFGRVPGFRSVMKLGRRARARWVAKEMRNPTSRKIFKSITARILARTGGVMVGETATEDIQQLEMIGVRRRLQGRDVFAALDPAEVAEIKQVTVQTLASTALIGAGGGGISVFSDHRLQAAETQRDKWRMDKAREWIREGSARADSPAIFRQLTAEIALEEGIEDVAVPIERLLELYQEEGLGPKELALDVPEIADQLEDAALRGDVRIPVGRYFDQIDKRFGDKIIEDLRINDGQTLREMREISKAKQTEVDAVVQEEAKAQKRGAFEDETDVQERARTSADRVFDAVTKLLSENTPMPKDAVQNNALLWRSRFRARAERNGRDAFEMFVEENPEIETVFETAELPEGFVELEQVRFRDQIELRLRGKREPGERLSPLERRGEFLFQFIGEMKRAIVDPDTGDLIDVAEQEVNQRTGLIVTHDDLARRSGLLSTPAGIRPALIGSGKGFTEGFILPTGEFVEKFATDRALEAFVETRGLELEQRDPPDLKTEIPGLAGILPDLTASEKKNLRRDFARRMVGIFETLPSAGEIASVAFAAQVQQGWYEQSGRAIVDIFGIQDAPRFTALLAALSPQTDVETDAVNALNTWAAWIRAGRPVDRPSVMAILGESVRGDLGEESVLDAWRNNSFTALTAVDPTTIVLSGPKANAFLLNLKGQADAVTLDAWMANLFGLAPGELATKSTYLAVSAKVRRAAKILTRRTGVEWTPAEVQATVWSWGKALLEQRLSAKETRDAVSIITEERLDPERVAGVPEFSVLFTNGVYRRILEEAGLGEAVEAVARRGEPARRDAGRESELAQQARGIAEASYTAHLKRAAARLEKLAVRRQGERAEQRAEFQRDPELARRTRASANLRRRGLLGPSDEFVFRGDTEAQTFGIPDLQQGTRNTPEAQRSLYRALRLETRPGENTSRALKVYPLEQVFSGDFEAVKAKLQPWLDRIGWKWEMFGPNTQGKKAFYPDFRDENTPSYGQKTAWIFSPFVDDGSFRDPAYTLAWRVTHEIAHGLVNEELTKKYGDIGSRAGALGVVIRGPYFKKDESLTLVDGLRAIEWEHRTFQKQREILETEFGIRITDEQFNKENSINMADAVYRVISGQFGNPGEIGIMPSNIKRDRLFSESMDVLRQAAMESGAELAEKFIELEQAEGVKRASILINPEVRNVVIRLTEAQNLSSFIHESGHLFMFQLFKDAREKGANTQLKADAQHLLDWFGIASFEEMTHEHHELFARSWEAYIRRGQAPSQDLRGVFARMRQWLMQIYPSIKDLFITGEPPQEIRDVMDRLIATDDEIAKAREIVDSEFILDAELGLMTRDQQLRYDRAIERSREAAHEQVNKQILADLERQRTQTWRDQRERIEQEVELDVNQRRVFNALHFLTTGQMLDGTEAPDGLEKMDREMLIELVGPEKFRRLPFGDRGVHKKNGSPPERVAEIFGYDTPGELIDDILESGSRAATIQRETDIRMKLEHGDLLDDGKLQDRALEAIHNEDTLRVLLIEERALTRRAGGEVTPQRAARQAAERMIAEMPVKELRPHRFRQAAARHGRAALEAANRGDWLGAQAGKRRQIVNTALEMEARRIREQTATAHRRIRTFEKLSKQQKLGLAGFTYRQQVNDILGRFSFHALSIKAGEKREALAKFIADRRAEDPLSVAIPEKIQEEAFKKPWKELTVEELFAVRDALLNIEKLASLKVEITLGRDKRALDEIEAEISSDIRAKHIEDRPTIATEGLGTRRDRFAAKVDAALRRGEFVIDQLTQADPLSLLRTLVWQPLQAANIRYEDMLDDYTARVDRLMTEHIGKEKQRSYHRMLDETRLTDKNGNVIQNISKWWLISAAMNMGNESNKRKLLDGYGWTEELLMEVLNERLEESDFRFVQAIWTEINTLWPEIKALEERDTGIAPPKIQPTTLNTRFGSFEGGYFPVVYDRDLSTMGARNTPEGIMPGVYDGVTRATTGHGHTQERIEEATAPLKLSLDVLTAHLDQVILDLTHREVIRNVSKILGRRGVDDAMRAAMGPRFSYQDYWVPLLRHVARDTVHPGQLSAFNDIARWLRLRGTVFTLGFRATTLIMQISGLQNGYRFLRSRVPAEANSHILTGLRTLIQMQQWKANYERISGVSDFMRTRVGKLDRDMRAIIREAQESGTFVLMADRMGFGRPAEAISVAADRLAKGSMRTIGWVQIFTVDIPIWIAAEKAAMETLNMTPDQAVLFADSIVRQSQGAGTKLDQSAIERGGVNGSDVIRATTMFYSYQNTVYNQLADARLVPPAGKNEVSFSNKLSGYALYALGPGLFAYAVHSLFAPDRLPDPDDKDFEFQLFGDIVEIVGGDVLGTVPWLREVWRGFVGGRGRGITIGDRFVSQAQRLAKPRDGMSFLFDGIRTMQLVGKLPGGDIVDRVEDIIVDAQ